MSYEDEKLLLIIKRIISNGNDAEVRRNPDGTFKVLEVKKNKVLG